MHIIYHLQVNCTDPSITEFPECYGIFFRNMNMIFVEKNNYVFGSQFKIFLGYMQYQFFPYKFSQCIRRCSLRYEYKMQIIRQNIRYGTYKKIMKFIRNQMTVINYYICRFCYGNMFNDTSDFCNSFFTLGIIQSLKEFLRVFVNRKESITKIRPEYISGRITDIDPYESASGCLCIFTYCSCLSITGRRINYDYRIIRYHRKFVGKPVVNMNCIVFILSVSHFNILFPGITKADLDSQSCGREA